MKKHNESKIRQLGIHLGGPAAVVFTVFALGAPVKWSIVVQGLFG